MTADNPVHVLHVRGDHYQLGFQHGQQARDKRHFIEQAMEARFSQLETDGADNQFEALLVETETLLPTIDPATVEMVRGLAAGLSLSYERLLRYNLIPFLRDALTTRRAEAGGALTEGCTTWAASGVATRSGQPVLVKNRDYHLDNSPLQVVIQAEPARGYRYTYVTSAGSPGVFVAGFNEAGLALVDTHVPTPDVGPGLPTYALSMHILEEQRTVRTALDYLQTTARLGRNNLLLADAGGDIALVEMSHRHVAVLEAEAGLLVNTTSLGMHGQPPLEIDLSPLPGEAVVNDIVYVPLQTPLLAAAKARGLRTVDGLGMLLHQARPGFERWFGHVPEVTQSLFDLIAKDIGS